MLYDKSIQKNTCSFRFVLRGALVEVPGRGSYYEDHRCFFVNWSLSDTATFRCELLITSSQTSVLRKDGAILSQMADCIDNSKTLFEFENAIQAIGFVEEN